MITKAAGLKNYQTKVDGTTPFQQNKAMILVQILTTKDMILSNVKIIMKNKKTQIMDNLVR